MRIVILSESAYPVLNGVSVSTDYLANGLSNLDYDVTLITPKNPKPNNDSEKNYKIIRTPSINIVKDYPLPLFCKGFVYDILNKINPDIVFAQIPFMYGNIGKQWAKENNKVFATCNHTLYIDYLHYFSTLPAPLLRKLLKNYLKKFYNSSDYVLTPSVMMKNQLLSYGVKKDIEIIATGIELPKEKNLDEVAKIKSQLNINENDKVIIYLSRIAKEKNIYMLIDAFEDIYYNHKDVKLVICGSGPEFKNLSEYREKLVCRENIILTGMIEKSKVYKYLYCGDIFAFPSYTETQGLAVCEAMAAGLGVVAVNEGGVPEFIKNNYNGLLANNNINDFKGRLLELLENKSLLEKIKINAKESSNQFTIDEMIRKYEELFKRMLKK